MRKYARKALELLNGFLILSVCYVCILQRISENFRGNLIKSLLLFPVLLVCSVSAEKVKHFWQYALAAILVCTAAFRMAGGGYPQIWMGFFVILTAVSYFGARAGEKDCWLDEPVYPWLGLYMAIYFLSNNLADSFMMGYVSIAAGLHFLICNIHTNLTQMNDFVKTHRSLERFPLHRLGLINRRMMWLQTLGITAAMCAAPFLGMDQVIRKAGKLLKSFLSMLLRHLPSGEEEEAVRQAGERMSMTALPEAEPVPGWLEMLYKVLDVLCWILVIVLIFFFLRMIFRKMYEMYRRFNDHTEENGDKIESLLGEPQAEQKDRMRKRKGENLFWDRSFSARIQKYYKKRILREYTGVPEPHLTPAELEERVKMEPEDRKCFHGYYEKARYSREACTKEEVQKMMGLR